MNIWLCSNCITKTSIVNTIINKDCYQYCLIRKYSYVYA